MNIKADPRIINSVASAATKNPSPDKAKSLKQLRESTRELETMYVYEAYKAMRKNIPDNGLIKKSSGEKMFQEMLDLEMARKAASGKGMGLGEAMYQQLKDKVK